MSLVDSKTSCLAKSGSRYGDSRLVATKKNRIHTYTHTHTHTYLTALFPGQLR